jgi:hypothetical protein
MHPATGRRREFLLVGAVALAGVSAVRSAGAQTTEYAVFSEFSPASKPMATGWNRRIFTDIDSRKGTGIQCDFATGIVTLSPGAYRLTGYSMVAYDSGGEPPEMTTIRAPASAGYCRLRVHNPAAATVSSDLHAIDNSDPSVICVGSPATPNLSPSLFDAYWETGKAAQIVLEHQSGTSPRQIYLRVFVEKSKWHAFARLTIQRL